MVCFKYKPTGSHYGFTRKYVNYNAGFDVFFVRPIQLLHVSRHTIIYAIEHYKEVILIKDILEEIQRLRLARNWTEYELAVHSDLSQSTISTWYRKKQVPTIRSLEKICLGFGITLSQFFAEDNDTFSPTKEQWEMLEYWSALTQRQKELFLELFKSIP